MDCSVLSFQCFCPLLIQLAVTCISSFDLANVTDHPLVSIFLKQSKVIHCPELIRPMSNALPGALALPWTFVTANLSAAGPSSAAFGFDFLVLSPFPLFACILSLAGCHLGRHLPVNCCQLASNGSECSDAPILSNGN